ncbi:MAG: DNA polymerase IV [Actinomycetota bacterium]|nr:DNA polymerase IV [Actinomycetota bacterium]
MARKIAHLDMDAFYASVELQRHPELVGKPVVVSGTGPRAVVTTASYEARKFGVGSAMPASRARRLCPDAHWLPVDHAHYRERSAEVRALMEELGLPIEPVSLDEAYLDLSEVSDPIARMSALVKRIRDKTGLDASVGIGPNKLVAKIASDAEKPRGFVILTREQAAERFKGEPVRLIPGIGPKTARRLDSYGVKTIGQLQRCTVPGLVERFGETHGRSLHERAHFHSDAPVTTERIAKSRSVETTFDYDVEDRERLEEVIAGQSERLAAELRKREARGRTIGIKVRTDNFATFTRVRSIPEFTNDPKTIRDVALALLRENFPERPVRLLGVRVASFADEAPAGGESSAPSLLDHGLTKSTDRT